jgi:hypothetical protein
VVVHIAFDSCPKLYQYRRWACLREICLVENSGKRYGAYSTPREKR